MDIRSVKTRVWDFQFSEKQLWQYGTILVRQVGSETATQWEAIAAFQGCW